MSIQDDLEAVVRDHMDSNPYSVLCENCNRSLNYDHTVDRDLDLTITVTPCDCMEED